MRVTYVLGAPCSGTSCVAGILHHLGVDMGAGHFIDSRRPYETFEDSRCRECLAPGSPTEAQRFIMGLGTGGQTPAASGRDFRAYLWMRLFHDSESAPKGVKIGSAYWLGDPDPATLPVRIVKVDRPLEDSIRSDWKYRSVRPADKVLAPGEAAERRILRAAQMAGYWQAKERLCEIIPPAITVPFYDLLREPSLWIASLIEALRLPVEPERLRAAREFVKT